jgi:DNA-binding GntR family transcriptional regulator
MSATSAVLQRAGTTAPSTLKTHVFKALRDAIVSGRYKPGQRLNESQLAREFNISRIPIREALMQLGEHGLVMNHARRGMFVTALSEEDVQRINSMRLVLEAEALKLCAAHMTRGVADHLTRLVDQMDNWGPKSDIDAAAIDLEFHRTMWNAAGNPYLTKALDSLATVLFAHTALENVNHHVRAWRLHHHRTLLQVVLGESDMSVEDAVLSHLQIHFKAPERFSSIALKTAKPQVVT